MPGIGALAKYIAIQMAKKSGQTKPFLEEFEFVKGYGWLKKVSYSFAERLSWIRHGDDVSPQFVEQLIQESADVQSLKTVRQYLDANHFDPDTTAELLGEAKEKAFKILWKAKGEAAFDHFIDAVGDPLALIESVADYLC